MTIKPDPYLPTIMTFFEAHKAPVFIKKISGGYSIHMTEDKTPIARLRLSSDSKLFEVLWWGHRDKWESIGDFDGLLFASLDEALMYVWDDPMECFWPY